MAHDEKNLSLLIVDDDTDDIELFIEAAKEIDENIVCTIANNGRQALELLRNSASPLPDFIFLDIRMPLLDGKKCLSEIKEDERLKAIPVIIYTTSKEVEESKALRSMGAVYLSVSPATPRKYIISSPLH